MKLLFIVKTQSSSRTHAVAAKYSNCVLYMARCSIYTCSGHQWSLMLFQLVTASELTRRQVWLNWWRPVYNKWAEEGEFDNSLVKEIVESSKQMSKTINRAETIISPSQCLMCKHKLWAVVNIKHVLCVWSDSPQLLLSWYIRHTRVAKIVQHCSKGRMKTFAISTMCFSFVPPQPKNGERAKESANKAIGRRAAQQRQQ